jgi:Flp pilus assembly protein CpaB
LKFASVTVLARGLVAGEAVSFQVSGLTEGMVSAMNQAKLKVGVPAVVGALVAASYVAWFGPQSLSMEPTKQSQKPDTATQGVLAAKSASESEPIVEVLIVREGVNPHFALVFEDFDVRHVPENMATGWIRKEQFDSLVKGKMAKVRLSKNKPLTAQDLHDPERDQLHFPYKTLGPGEIVSTVKIQNTVIVPRSLEPGTRVDIEATTRTPDGENVVVQTILKDIEVLSIDGLNGIQLHLLNRDDALLLGSYKSGPTLRFLPRSGDAKKQLSPRTNNAASPNPGSGATSDGKSSKPATNRFDKLLQELLVSNRSDAQVIEALYLAAQARLPSDAELKKANDRIAAAANRQKAFENLLQTLVAPK